jgi:hypothetical protein
MRVSINPASDVAAATQLANGTSGFAPLYPGDVLPVISSAAITDLYLLVTGDGGTDAGGDNIVDTSAITNANGQHVTTVGTVAMFDATPAELTAATNMVHLEFASVDDVRQVLINFGPTFQTNTMGWIGIEGRSYA